MRDLKCVIWSLGCDDLALNPAYFMKLYFFFEPKENATVPFFPVDAGPVELC